MKKLAPIAAVLLLMLSLSTCTRAEDDPDAAVECLAAMADAAVRGDDAAGETAQSERERIIAETRSGDIPVSYSELSALSRFIFAQAAGDWLSDELRLCVGEVALNRVSSPDFPDELETVCLDCGLSEAEYRALRPSRACVNAALRLLQGERLLSPEVLYISSDKKGEIYATFYSRLRGYTYFLTSQ